MMTKRIEMRLGDYRMIGRSDDDGIVTVQVEHAVEGRIEAELTLGGEGVPAAAPAGGTASFRDRMFGQDPPSERETVHPRAGEAARADAPTVGIDMARGRDTPFPERPGMTRSRIGPDPE